MKRRLWFLLVAATLLPNLAAAQPVVGGSPLAKPNPYPAANSLFRGHHELTSKDGLGSCFSSSRRSRAVSRFWAALCQGMGDGSEYNFDLYVSQRQVHFADLHRPARKRDFALLTAVQWAGMVADYELSQRHLAAGGVETMPWFGSQRPSRARMYAIGGAVNGVTTYLGFRAWQQGKPRWWKWQMGMTLAHGGGMGMTLRF